MSQTSSWDDMRRVREEEYFYNTEREKIVALKEKRDAERTYLIETNNALATFTRGFSPVRGGRLFKASVGQNALLDCPEEGTLTLTYEALEELLKAAKTQNQEALETWEKFLKIATSKA